MNPIEAQALDVMTHICERLTRIADNLDKLIQIELEKHGKTKSPRGIGPTKDAQAKEAGAGGHA